MLIKIRFLAGVADRFIEYLIESSRVDARWGKRRTKETKQNSMRKEEQSWKKIRNQRDEIAIRTLERNKNMRNDILDGLV